MGFIGSSSAHELAAQTDLQQPDADPIDFEIEVGYELELELAAAEESESDTEFEDDEIEPTDALQSNDTSDLFEFFFREQARLAFLNRDN